MAHALLSPSSASRWLQCTRSARMEEPFEDEPGEAALEGTLAHAISEWTLKQHFGMVSKAKSKHELAKLKADPLYGKDMQHHIDDYVSFVLEEYSEMVEEFDEVQIFFETELDVSEWVPESFGTGDIFIFGKKKRKSKLRFIDLKYGKGVLVKAEENKQMMLYSLGALKKFSQYNILEISMCIYQPRLNNVSNWDVKTSWLLEWAETELKPKAELAFAGEGEHSPGIDTCRFCKAKAVCKPLADKCQEVAKYDFATDGYLDEEGLLKALELAPLIASWAKEVESYALKQMLSGRKLPGYKLVEGRSQRVFMDEQKIAKIAMVLGEKSEDEIYNRRLKGIGEFEKMFGKNEFQSLFGKYVLKPKGAPTIAPESDPRETFRDTKFFDKATNYFSPIKN